jgi:arylsulfatase A-like enzyme
MIRSALCVVAALAGGTAAAAEAARPNILLIFSDDHAEQAVSAYGSRVNSTPHLDRLAAVGARFANSFVTNSICSPSRATLLTGQYSHVNGVPVFNSFEGSRNHVAKLLRAAGYHTGLVGKWHLGSDPTGFDRWIVLPGQGAYRDPQFLVPGHTLTVKGHASEVITDLGIEFLKTRPVGRPFFLMLHHKAPHRPWEPDERHASRFTGADIPEPATLRDDYATRPAALPGNRQTIARDLTPKDLKRNPPEGLAGDDLLRWKYRRFMEDYLACVQGVDDSVGRMLDFLDQAGLAESTVVIYTTDNGWYMGEHGLYDKRFMYEPGLRVPLVARGPGVSPGVVPSQFVANIDLAPTFLDLAGVAVPDWMQGRSLVPLLRGEAPADWRTSVYYRYYDDPGYHDTRAHYGVRTATHKLIHYWRKDAWEMYDLAADPHELHNLLFDPAEAARPEVAATRAALKAELARLQARYADDGRFADPATLPKDGVEGDKAGKTPLGVKTADEAIAAAGGEP